MRIGNKIEKRLSKINSFLSSKKKPGTKDVHLLRLEVKHLQAFLQLMAAQKDFDASPGIPLRLEKLFHNAGKIRKFELENKAIRSITNENEIFRPTFILELLNASKRKMVKNLRKKRRTYQTFKSGDFAKHPDSKLSIHTWQKFMVAQAESVLNLLEGDIVSDIRSLHQLRKILKSIIYISPVGKNTAAPVQAFLDKHKESLKSIESKIGSIHDADFFIRWLEKNHYIEQGPGQVTLEKTILVWKNNMMKMKDDIHSLLPVIRQFALDLKHNLPQL